MALRKSILGRGGLLSALMIAMRRMTAAERRQWGTQINRFKAEVGALFEDTNNKEEACN